MTVDFQFFRLEVETDLRAANAKTPLSQLAALSCRRAAQPVPHHQPTRGDEFAWRRGLVGKTQRLFPQTRELSSWRKSQARSTPRGRQAKFQRNGHGLVERHTLGFGLEPAYENTSTVRYIAVGLSGIEAAPILSHQAFHFRCELLAIELTNCVLRIGRQQDPLFVPGISINGQLEHIGALKQVAFAIRVAGNYARQFPCAQVLRGENVNRVNFVLFHI